MTSSRADGRPLQVTEQGALLIVEMNRPQVRNAMDLPTAELMAEAIDRLDSQDHLRVAVLTGRGGYFCSGMDLRAFAQTGKRPVIAGRGFAGVVEAPPRKPLIAAIEGPAVAGGFELALAADLVVAARTATFGLPEVKRGLVAAGGGLLRLAHRLPAPLASELVLTGDAIDAQRAHEIGLINWLVDEGTAVESAIELGQRLVQNAPPVRPASDRRGGWPGWSGALRCCAGAGRGPTLSSGARGFAANAPGSVGGGGSDGGCGHGQ